MHGDSWQYLPTKKWNVGILCSFCCRLWLTLSFNSCLLYGYSCFLLWYYPFSPIIVGVAQIVEVFTTLWFKCSHSTLSLYAAMLNSSIFFSLWGFIIMFILQSANCFHAVAMTQHFFRNVRVVLHFTALLGGQSYFCVHLQAKTISTQQMDFYWKFYKMILGFTFKTD